MIFIDHKTNNFNPTFYNNTFFKQISRKVRQWYTITLTNNAYMIELEFISHGRQNSDDNLHR